MAKLLKIVPEIKQLRSLFQRHSFPIVYTREGWADDYSDSGPLLDGMFAPLKDMKGLVRGTWDFDIIDDLAPGNSDSAIVIDKTRNSAFWHTNLTKLLQQKGVNQLVVTGVGTNVCVESTVRDAISEGFHTITVSNATAALSEEEHQGSMMNLKYFGGTATVTETEAALESL